MIEQYIDDDIEYEGLNKLIEDSKLWVSSEIERQENFVWNNPIRARFGTIPYQTIPYHIILYQTIRLDIGG